MIPDSIKSLVAKSPHSLFHLGSSANEELWGRGVGFPILLIEDSSLDEEAFQDLSDTFDDVLSELEIELFDEKKWTHERYQFIGIAGVFDDPDDEQLQDSFPYVAQMDGVLLWDNERCCVMLMDTDMSSDDGFEEALICVADSPEALLAVLDNT
ncbi:MAG: hypothetical protein JKY56_13575 [Kofleriaceae bacterium]|nr:hypothetical protein [Kofleriaceae bacterium]